MHFETGKADMLAAMIIVSFLFVFANLEIPL